MIQTGSKEDKTGARDEECHLVVGFDLSAGIEIEAINRNHIRSSFSAGGMKSWLIKNTGIDQSKAKTVEFVAGILVVGSLSWCVVGGK